MTDLENKVMSPLEAIDRDALEPGSVDDDDLRAVFSGLFEPEPFESERRA